MNSVRENVSFKNSEKTVDKTVEKIIALLVQNPEITQNELQLATGLSRRGVEWNIQKLKARGIIERIGPNNGGYWKVNID